MESAPLSPPPPPPLPTLKFSEFFVKYFSNKEDSIYIKRRLLTLQYIIFWEQVVPGLPKPSTNVKISEYSLIRIPAYFIKQDIPVAHMTQVDVMAALEGLDWHVQSDKNFTTERRTDEWVSQCCRLMEMLFFRCVELASYPEYSSEVLNHVDYSENAKGARDFETSVINEAFLYDVFIYVACFYSDIYNSLKYLEVEKGEPKDISKVMDSIKDRASRIREGEVIRFRNEYAEDMLVTPAHLEIHVRKQNGIRQTKSRSVIAYKYNDIWDKMYQCSSVGDVLSPIVGDPEHKVTSYDAMLMMFNRTKLEDPIGVLQRPGEPHIFYCRLRRCWVVSSKKGSCWYPSLVEAYVYACEWGTKNGVTLSMFK